MSKFTKNSKFLLIVYKEILFNLDIVFWYLIKILVINNIVKVLFGSCCSVKSY